MNSSRQVSLCGLIIALAITLMLLTGLVPFGTFALPAFAGILLIVVFIEMGAKWALLSYIGTSIISFFIAPDREAAMFFIMIFGYYPLLKFFLDSKIKNPFIRYIPKFLVFNASVVSLYLVLIYLLGLTEVVESMGEFGQWGLVFVWIIGNITFFVYDNAIYACMLYYKYKIRPKINRH